MLAAGIFGDFVRLTEVVSPSKTVNGLSPSQIRLGKSISRRAVAMTKRFKSRIPKYHPDVEVIEVDGPGVSGHNVYFTSIIPLPSRGQTDHRVVSEHAVSNISMKDPYLMEYIHTFRSELEAEERVVHYVVTNLPISWKILRWMIVICHKLNQIG